MISVGKFLLLIWILTAVFCSKVETTDEFAEYLQEEKRIRGTVSNPQQLEDSLEALRKQFDVDPDLEISKLQEEPAEWISLLRKLKSAK
jgi:hypothetical protein